MIIRRGAVIIISLIAVFVFPQISFALYTWVDDQGIVHMTDYPKPGSRPEEKEQPEPASAGAPARSEMSSPEIKAGISPAMSQPARQDIQPKPSSPASAPPAQDAKAGKPVTATMLPIQSPNKEAASSASKTIQPAAAPGIPAVKPEPPAASPVASTPAVSPVNLVAALAAGFLSVFLFVIVAVYIYFSLCLYLIAKKLDLPTAWTAWIPIVQIAAFLGSAGKPLWWILLFFIPLVNIGVSVYLWMCIAENLGKNKMLGVLTIVPIVNFIIMGVLAFSKKEGGMAASPA